jgi:hypothetical protein
MDAADIASIRMEDQEEAAREAARVKASAIPKGEPGDCDLCGEWSARLVGGACARCRDKYKLP